MHVPVSELLFGGGLSLARSVYMPIRLECVDRWFPQSSGITRRDIVVNHTLYPYWAMTFQSPHAELAEQINSGKLSTDIQWSGASRIRGSKVKYLKYLTANIRCLF